MASSNFVKLANFPNLLIFISTPQAKALPSCVKDTADFISKLENVKDTSKDSVLVTLDVKALYTNIPNHGGIEAVKETLNNQAKKSIATRAIIKFVYLTLTLNNFVFNGINYIQNKGCAIFAPAYVNTCVCKIFRGKFEKLHIYPYLRNFLIFYCRFIDDMFFLWDRTESELIKFIHNLNQKHPTIKFEFDYYRTSVTLLDTKVYKNENRTLCATIYRKPSDHRNFLHYNLAHPKALKDSIPYSQALRIKRISFEASEVIKDLKDLEDAFIKKALSI